MASNPPAEPPALPLPPSRISAGSSSLRWPYSEQRLPEQSPAYVPVAPAPAAFQRNVMLTIAQVLAVVQGLLAFVTGVNIIRADVYLNSFYTAHAPSNALPWGVNSIFVSYGVAVLIIAIGVIVAGIRVGHPRRPSLTRRPLPVGDLGKCRVSGHRGRAHRRGH